LQRVPNEIAGLRHLPAVMHLVEVDDRLDCFLLAEEETLPNRLSLLVALEPPLEEAASHDGCAGVASLPPCANLAAELIDEVIELLVGRQRVFEKVALGPNETRDPAPRFGGGRQESLRWPSPFSELRTAAPKNLIVLV